MNSGFTAIQCDITKMGPTQKMGAFFKVFMERIHGMKKFPYDDFVSSLCWSGLYIPDFKLHQIVRKGNDVISGCPEL